MGVDSIEISPRIGWARRVLNATGPRICHPNRLRSTGIEVMTSQEIRKSFLDFFESKGHTIVPSSSLMPDAPNLLFTNAGMNQFVPFFLGEQKCPYSPARAADTQKCIRAGGKHNDLEDVGMDTYHHTFFEMLGNWSFGDYFKKEAIDWAWELLTEVWKFPVNRMYATVYNPDREAGDPSEFDQEAWDLWAEKFRSKGLDPAIHIVNGNKKDNFWMMGDTGPCGPCSEVHMDLTPNGDTGGSLVNADSPLCIEIWNLVFIQYNANPDGTYSDLPARHVDTGMGFERVASIIQNTNGFSRFDGLISNYETDVFRPIFEAIEKLSGCQYKSTLPAAGATDFTEQEKVDIAFRVLADHIRTLSFSIADGILPGNNDRNYVLRRILRRAVKYGRTLGFNEPFFYKLVAVLVGHMGEFFPELIRRQKVIEETLLEEEQSFNRTLDRGLQLYQEQTAGMKKGDTLSGDIVFKLYDTYGFPSDLTELMAREQGYAIDSGRFDALMEEQRERARKGRSSQVISVSDIDTSVQTQFHGYDELTGDAQVRSIVDIQGRKAVVVEDTPFYAEMGGQLGDHGIITARDGGKSWKITNTTKVENTFLHFIEGDDVPAAGTEIRLEVDRTRRLALERHHTVTHLLHWALHEVVSREAVQKGSYVGPEKLTFDFNSKALTPAQVLDVERLVNERILENEAVSWFEMPYSAIRDNPDIMQAFGEKYGDVVRIVQIGGQSGRLDGYSVELCGGTHTRRTGDIGLFRITGEGASSAGIRRIEAIAGWPSWDLSLSTEATLRSLAESLGCPVVEVPRKVESLIEGRKQLEKQLKALRQSQAVEKARSLVSQAESINGIPFIGVNTEGDGDTGQSMVDALRSGFGGVIVLLARETEKVSLFAAVGSEFQSRIKAGDIIRSIAPVVGGKGGGRPDQARGGGSQPENSDKALAAARELLS